MITSTKNETIKKIMKLKQKKYRDEEGLFLIEGFHLVEEARKNQSIVQLITTLDDEFEEDTIYVTNEVMKKLAFTMHPQPIMAVCKKKEDNNILLNKNRYILLERVQDPGNVGTIIRTALALGIDQVVLSSDSVDLYNDKVIRSTQGTLFEMNIITMDIMEAVQKLKENHVLVYGTCLEGALSIDNYEIKDKMAFIFGNEGQGMSEECKKECDHLVYIPIQGAESLNVGIASAITMYHFRSK